MSVRWQAELARQGAQFSDGRVATFGNGPEAGFSALRDGVVLCDLSHYGLMLASGDDAQAFLHGQFCNDVLALGDNALQWNGWCSPKGRLLVTLLAWPGRQGICMLLPRSLQGPIQKRLQMFILRAKVKITDESENWVRFGVAGSRAEVLLREFMGAVPADAMSTLRSRDGRIIRLSETRFMVIAPLDLAVTWWNELATKAVKVGAATWDWLSIQQGVITVLPETQDAFVPQMANFELIGGVSFKKGCYPGQEIVARTQYRGILKRRMVLAHMAGANSPMAGDKLYSEEFGDQAAGEIANVAAAPGGGVDMLVVAQIAAIRGNKLKYSSLDGVDVTIQRLPYDLPMS